MASSGIRRILVTGASGKLGRALSAALVDAGYAVRALVHARPVDLDGIERFEGSVTDYSRMAEAVDGMDAVVHLATTKSDRETFFDVSLRGTWNLLDAARQYGGLKRWIQAGGDAAMGIWCYPQPVPIHENMPLNAYPGDYAFSKVVEEVMGVQYRIQYGLPYVCLRCSWIMAADDILRHLTVTGKTMGAPKWIKYLTEGQKAAIPAGEDRVPIGVKADGTPIVRHIVHMDDVVAAFLLALESPNAVGEVFHVAAPAAFAYDVAADYLSRKTGVPTMRVTIPEAHDFSIDISKARSILGYAPRYDIIAMIDAALELGKCGESP